MRRGRQRALYNGAKEKTMQTMWLLGGLGLGAGLAYLMDAEQGAARRSMVRGQVMDYGRQTGVFLDDTRQRLGQQAQAVLTRTSMSPGPQPGLGERLLQHAEERGIPYGLCLLGGVGLGVGLMYLLDPSQESAQRRARLREGARAYWRRLGTRPASEQERRTVWRIVQGQDTHRVDAHTRKPAQAQAWYAEPADYDSPVLYSEPFVTRQEAEAWAQAQDAQRKPWHIFQGQDTHRVDAHTRKPARAQAWYAEPADYDSPVLYSEPFVTRQEAEAWARDHNTR
jgi:hypothetical protein